MNLSKMTFGEIANEMRRIDDYDAACVFMMAARQDTIDELDAAPEMTFDEWFADLVTFLLDRVGLPPIWNRFARQ